MPVKILALLALGLAALSVAAGYGGEAVLHRPPDWDRAFNSAIVCFSYGMLGSMVTYVIYECFRR